MFRLMAALVLLMALPACAARYQPAGPVCCDAVLALEGLGNDGAQAFTATMRDGMTLHGHVWPAKETEAVILALHGFGDYSLAFDEAATWWQARGVTLYAPDQRGFGNSAEYGIWAEADTYAADAAELLSLLRKRHSGKPVYGLGMSMGGAIITVAAGLLDNISESSTVIITPAFAVAPTTSMPAAKRDFIFILLSLVSSMRNLHSVT